jgi:hypothetical protein
LPDGFFSNQKSHLEGLRLKNVNIFYGHLEYFTEILDILCPFGTFCIHLVHFSCFGIMCQETSGNPEWKAQPCRAAENGNCEKNQFWKKSLKSLAVVFPPLN